MALQLRPVISIATPASAAYEQLQPTCGGGTQPCSAEALLNPDGVILEDKRGQRYELGPLLADGSDVAGAAARSTVVDVTLGPDATAALASATSDSASAQPPKNQIAIIIDGEVSSAPSVVAPISGGKIQITGGFTRDQAQRLAAVLGGS